jgi:hypothetical protein
VVWIHLAKDRDQWRALMNMVMNLRVISWLAEWTISFSRRALLHGVS